MATLGSQSEPRRRLPRAPSIDMSVKPSEIIQRGDFFDMEQKQNMASKKRLTPEVVAMLLSLDYGCENAVNAKVIVQDSNSTKYGSEISQKRTDIGVANTKIALQGDIGLVNIHKTSGQPLGFSLREHNVNKFEPPGGIFVSRLTPGGIVEQNSLLSTGDEILEINHVPVKDYKLSDVVAMIQIPKKLVLRVRFRRREQGTEVAREDITENSEQSVRNINNNYINVKSEQNHGPDSHRTSSKPGTQSTPGLVARETGPAAHKFRRSSSGRILPVRPESEQNKSKPSTHFENRPNPHTSYTTNIVDSSALPRFEQGSKTNFNTQLDPNSTFTISESNNFRQRTSQTHIKKEIPNVNLNSKHHAPPSKQKGQKRSTVLPAPLNEMQHSQAKQRSGKDSSDGMQTSKRLDPGDIKFDIIATNDPKYSNFHSSSDIACRSLEKIKIEPQNDDVSKSALRKTSETFGSSSSLSSTDSPKSHGRKSKSSSSILETSGLSRSEILTHSSRLSDSSQLSSSAESEDQLGKGISENLIKHNQKPPLLHSVSSDDLNQSYNGWFSKIGNPKRKHVRKFSEGAQRPFSKSSTVGEPYRIQESTDASADEAEHGYRLYPGTSQDAKTSSRVVTGMLTLDIVKGAQIGSMESVMREKRKKTKVFCIVDCDGMRQASTVPKKGMNDFQWNESFEIELQRTREIRITVCSRSKKEDVKLAEGCLSAAQLLNEGSEHLLAICLEPCGMLCVKLKFTDMKLLLQRTPSQKKEGVFGFPLETVLRRENSRIPNLIRKCVEEINKRGLEVTGIYRICGNAAKKKALRAQFENSSATVDLSQTENPVDVNIITGILKDYLRELPQPLLSQDVRQLLSDAESEAVPDGLISQVIKQFPHPSKATIIYLLDHFVTVLMNSDVNKMNSHNLAVCIGPVLMCPSLDGTASTTVSDTKKDINAIKLLLEIWPKPEQVSAC